MQYQLLRFYQAEGKEPEVVGGAASLEEAQEYCKDPETSSSTATSPEARQRTAKYGPWFVGYREVGND